MRPKRRVRKCSRNHKKARISSTCHHLRSTHYPNHPLVEDAIGLHHTLAACHVALSEQAAFFKAEGTDNGVGYTLVVEQDKITLNPVMCVHIMRRDSRTLQPMNQIPSLLQVRDHFSIWLVNSLDSRRVDLEGKLSGNRVLPAHRQDLDLTLVDGRQLRKREFQSIRDHSQTISSALGWAHPDIWMRCIFDFRATDKLLVLLAENIVHILTRDEGSGAKWDIHLLSSAIIVSKGLASSSWDFDGHERSNLRWVERVQSSINVPSVESRKVKIILLRYNRFVKRFVVRMLERDVLQSFVLIVVAVSNDLNLWLVRDGLEIWVEDGTLGIQRLSVTIAAVTSWIKSFGEFILSCPLD